MALHDKLQTDSLLQSGLLQTRERESEGREREKKKKKAQMIALIVRGIFKR